MLIIINKMIGTGIFDTPSTIMHDTRSVGLTLIFWLLGSIATLAGTWCFIEYGLTIPRWQFNGEKIFTPRSGGEFNYLNYLIKRPQFFATCMYGVIFILIGNASANALSFAIKVLTAAGYTNNSENVVRAVAIGTMTGVCLLHGIWRKLGIVVNNVFALFKLLMLLMIIILGFISIGGKVFGAEPAAKSNLDPQNSFKNAQDQPYRYAQAYLGVVFAYGGFNQANYVLGEIRQPRRIFKKATFSAVGTVCVLYMLVNIAYMIVVPAESQITGNVAEQFIRLTLGRVSNYGDQHAAEILNAFTAVSSLGNVIVSTYTAARVKQEIAKEGILPFSRFFARNYDGITRLFSRGFRDRVSKELVFDKTPLGALLLHWFFALLIIFCTWGAKSAAAYTIIFGIFSYVIDAFFAVCMGLGLLGLRLRKGSNWHLKSSSNATASICAAILFVIGNAFPVVVLWVPPTQDFKSSYSWFLVPTISVCLLGAGVFYWVVFVSIVPHMGNHRGKKLKVERSPFFHVEDGDPVQVAEVVTFDWTVKS